METRGQLLMAHSLDHTYQIFSEAFDIENDSLELDLLRLDYVYHQRVFRLPRFLQKHSNMNTKFKSWSGDRKSPLFAFMHEIRFNGNSVNLNPVGKPLYYAFVHPQEKNGYKTQPTVVRELEQ